MRPVIPSISLRHRLSVKSAVVAATIAVASCSPAREASPTQLLSDTGPQARLATLTALDQRVGRVAWRLGLANADLCPLTRQSAGWMLHSANQYSLEMRPFAVASYGLAGDLPGLVAAPEDSPAAASGLSVGDLITAVNDKALETGSLDAAPSVEGLERNQQQLDRALAAGPVVLTVVRGGQSRSVRLEPLTACGYDVQVDPSNELNARADGRRLFISSAMAAYAASDADLALVLGHELAHHVLGHRTWHGAEAHGRQVGAAAVSARGGSERSADRAGLYLMARAGLDTSGAAAFWRRFGQVNWRVRFPQLHHPSAESRATSLEAVHLEIEAKRAAGLELKP